MISVRCVYVLCVCLLVCGCEGLLVWYVVCGVCCVLVWCVWCLRCAMRGVRRGGGIERGVCVSDVLIQC